MNFLGGCPASQCNNEVVPYDQGTYAWMTACGGDATIFEDIEDLRDSILISVDEVLSSPVYSALNDNCNRPEVDGAMIEGFVQILASVTDLIDDEEVPELADQVADVLEIEGNGSASSAEEVVMAIAEVVAENVINPPAAQHHDACEGAEDRLFRKLDELEAILSQEKCQRQTPQEIVINEVKTVTSVAPGQEEVVEETVTTSIKPLQDDFDMIDFTEPEELPTLQNCRMKTRREIYEPIEEEEEPMCLNEAPPMRSEIYGTYMMQTPIAPPFIPQGKCNRMVVEEGLDFTELENLLDEMGLNFGDECDRSMIEDDDMPELMGNLPGLPRGLTGGLREIYDDIPSNETLRELVKMVVLGGNYNCLVDRENFYDRKILMMIQVRLDEALRGKDQLMGCGLLDRSMERESIDEFVYRMMVPEVEQMRYDQALNQRIVRGYLPFGPRNLREDLRPKTLSPSMFPPKWEQIMRNAPKEVPEQKIFRAPQVPQIRLSPECNLKKPKPVPIISRASPEKQEERRERLNHLRMVTGQGRVSPERGCGNAVPPVIPQILPEAAATPVFKKPGAVPKKPKVELKKPKVELKKPATTKFLRTQVKKALNAGASPPKANNRVVVQKKKTTTVSKPAAVQKLVDKTKGAIPKASGLAQPNVRGAGDACGIRAPSVNVQKISRSPPRAQPAQRISRLKSPERRFGRPSNIAGPSCQAAAAAVPQPSTARRLPSPKATGARGLRAPSAGVSGIRPPARTINFQGSSLMR